VTTSFGVYLVLWLFELVCNVWVCVCIYMGFVICGCFGNTCTCIYCVLYCFPVFWYCFVSLFLFVLSVLVSGLLPPSEHLIAVNNNDDNNSNNNNNFQQMIPLFLRPAVLHSIPLVQLVTKFQLFYDNTDREKPHEEDRFFPTCDNHYLLLPLLQPVCN